MQEHIIFLSELSFLLFEKVNWEASAMSQRLRYILGPFIPLFLKVCLDDRLLPLVNCLMISTHGRCNLLLMLSLLLGLRHWLFLRNILFYHLVLGLDLWVAIKFLKDF